MTQTTEMWYSLVINNQEKEAEMTEQHLWEVEHPYYCSEDNYFSNDCTASYKSWAEFLENEGDSDPDINLVFRWDWESPRKEGNDPESPIKWQGDESYRDSRLVVFCVGQSKGFFRSVSVEVCRADEPAIKEWLMSRFHHLLKLWTPLPLPTLPTE